MNSSAEPSLPAATARSAPKPRFSIFIATACGLGYLPKAPGTWGSLGGLAAVTAVAMYAATIPFGDFHFDYDPFVHLAAFLLTCIIGVWSAGRAARGGAIPCSAGWSPWTPPSMLESEPWTPNVRLRGSDEPLSPGPKLDEEGGATWRGRTGSEATGAAST